MLQLHCQIQADFSKLIKQTGHEALQQEVAKLLTARFSHLGPVEAWGSTRQMGPVKLRAGRYLVSVSGLLVEINAQGRLPGDAQIARQLRQALIGLLARLGGRALQREVIRAIINAGYSIRTLSRQGDDLALLEMDWATVTVTLSGCLTITVSENYRPVAQRLLADLEAAGIEITPSFTPSTPNS